MTWNDYSGVAHGGNDRRLAMGGQVSRMRSVRTAEYYSATKRNGVLIRVAARVNPESLALGGGASFVRPHFL